MMGAAFAMESFSFCGFVTPCSMIFFMFRLLVPDFNWNQPDTLVTSNPGDGSCNYCHRVQREPIWFLEGDAFKRKYACDSAIEKGWNVGIQGLPLTVESLAINVMVQLRKDSTVQDKNSSDPQPTTSC